MTPKELIEIAGKNFDPRYTLSYHTHRNRPHKTNWSEGESYLYLFLAGKPSAFIGWEDVPDINQKRTRWITVIQGVFHLEEPKPTPPHEWELSLVRSLEEATKQTDVEQFAITPSRDIVWANIGVGEKLEKRRINFYRKYDQTAQRLGYTLARVKSPYLIPELYVKAKT